MGKRRRRNAGSRLAPRGRILSVRRPTLRLCRGTRQSLVVRNKRRERVPDFPDQFGCKRQEGEGKKYLKVEHGGIDVRGVGIVHRIWRPRKNHALRLPSKPAELLSAREHLGVDIEFAKTAGYQMTILRSIQNDQRLRQPQLSVLRNKQTQNREPKNGEREFNRSVDISWNIAMSVGQDTNMVSNNSAT